MGKKQNGKRNSGVKPGDTTTTRQGQQKSTTANKKIPKPTSSFTDSLPPEERMYLEKCTLDFASLMSSADNDDSPANNRLRQAFVHRAVEILEQEHMLVINNCLSEDETQVLEACYKELHQRQVGQRAIGERDASKRSGTRLYNCLCQLGPACGFYDWKDGTAPARKCLNPLAPSNNNNNNNNLDGNDDDDQQQYIFDYRTSKPPPRPVWKCITDKFHFTHIARVEIVTSHVGCRSQDWHVDGVHGLTVMFPLTDVGERQGPTELDFSHPFLGLWEGDGKVRTPQVGTAIRAVMPRGSVLMFNANASHRGSANIGSRDRPIVVLDCSLESTCLAAGGPRDIWSV
jgi:hypothetical protein